MSSDLQRRVRELRTNLNSLSQKVNGHDTYAELAQEASDTVRHMLQHTSEDEEENPLVQPESHYDEDELDEVMHAPRRRRRRQEKDASPLDSQPVTRADLKQMLKELEDNTLRRVNHVENRMCNEVEDLTFAVMSVLVFTFVFLGCVFFNGVKELLRKQHQNMPYYNYVSLRFDGLEASMKELKEQRLQELQQQQQQEEVVQQQAETDIQVVG